MKNYQESEQARLAEQQARLAPQQAKIAAESALNAIATQLLNSGMNLEQRTQMMNLSSDEEQRLLRENR